MRQAWLSQADAFRHIRSDTGILSNGCTVQDVDGQPIQLHLIYGLRRVEKWRHAHIGGWRSYSVELGQLPDDHPAGRWYTTTTQRAVNPDAWGWPDEHTARRHLAELKRAHNDWVEIPAAYTADRQPATPGPWVRSGASWRRP